MSYEFNRRWGATWPGVPIVRRSDALPAHVEPLERRALLAGDVVLQWNEILIDAIRAEPATAAPTWASRNMAIVHAAIFDAVNGIDGSYAPYLVNQQAPPGASIEAAAAAAAAQTLEGLYPAQQATFDAALAASLAEVPDGPAEDRGVAWGRLVAKQILAARENDGSETSVPYSYGDEPGDYQSTPPDYSPPLNPNWYLVKPFVMRSYLQFQSPPMAPMTSQQYARAFNEVKELGARNSATRTAEQTEIADFWSYDRPAMGSPIVLYNQIAVDVAEQQGNTLVENARMLALVNLAMGDAGIVAWHLKYKYDFWRPITAIRNADLDGNANTEKDATWEPLGAPNGQGPRFTPPFPSYTSGHSTFGAAAFGVLARFYGTDTITFTTASDELPGVTRTFRSFSEAAAENGVSRIYMGVHWSFDNEWGIKNGQAIGDHTYRQALRPRQGSYRQVGRRPPLQIEHYGGERMPLSKHAMPPQTQPFSLRLIDGASEELLGGTPQKVFA